MLICYCHQVFISNMETKRTESTPEEHADIITDVRFRSNSTLLATSSFDKTVKIWDASEVIFLCLVFSFAISFLLRLIGTNLCSLVTTAYEQWLVILHQWCPLIFTLRIPSFFALVIATVKSVTGTAILRQMMLLLLSRQAPQLPFC